MIKIMIITDFSPNIRNQAHSVNGFIFKKPPLASPEWLFFHAFLGWSTIYSNRRQVQDSAGYYY